MIGLIDLVVRTLAGPAVEAGVPAGVEVRRSRVIPWLGGLLSGMGEPAAAVTLGRTILLRPDLAPAPRLVRHELAHVAQWERHPVTFPIRYIAAHIRHGYLANPYEREARRAETESSHQERS